MRVDRDYRLVPLDDERAALLLSGTHHLFVVSRQTAERLQDGVAALTAEERREWAQLAEAGALADRHAARLREVSVLDGADLALNINLTSICNLGCTYCFAEGGDYGRIKGKLESDAVPHILEHIFRHHGEARRVRFEFFGGEPLLNLERIAELCAASERLQADEGIEFVHRISTNLTVLPERALELFARHRFIVSVSIDGGRETQDRNRPDKGGGGSFDRVMRNVHRVRAVSDEVALVARMTVVGDRPSILENVHELEGHDVFDWFQIYPGVVPRERAAALGGAGSRRLPVVGDGGGGAVMLPSFLDQLDELLHDYPRLLSRGRRFRGLLEVERLAQMLAEGRMATSFCSAGRGYFTFSPDRSIMPCHRMVGQEAMAVGRFDEGVRGELAAWRATVDDNPVCGTCSIRYLCGGGCKQENQLATGSLASPNRDGCRYQLRLVDAVVRLLERMGEGWRARDRRVLEDLFVSCGRPVVDGGRADVAGSYRHFQPLFAAKEVAP